MHAPHRSATTRPLLRRTPVAGFTTRFAPAPTGHLHLGHAVNAVWVWGLAQAYGGRVLLRIEDHDRGRCRPDYEASILDDLDWLSLVPDGVRTTDFRRGPTAQRQSDGGTRYTAALEALTARGLVYACRCSRAEVGQPQYPGTCRHAAIDPASTPARRVRFAPEAPERFEDLRLGAQSQDPVQQCGDLLVRDRAGNWTYQFAVVLDDLEQGVDLIIRGEDLLDSTGRQFRLARLLGRGTMPSVVHHPLVAHPDGRKLSKSSGDTGLRELRAQGVPAAAVLGRAAMLGGLRDDSAPLDARDLGTLFRDG